MVASFAGWKRAVLSLALVALPAGCADDAASPVEQSTPRVDPRCAPAAYREIVAGALPVGATVERMADAFVTFELQAIEHDLFEDDLLTRSGWAIALGREGDDIIALTTRFSTDFGFPSTRLVDDGWGAAELGAQWMALGNRPEDRLTLVPAQAEAAAMSGRASLAFVGDHDLALVALPSDHPRLADVVDLGLEEPTRVVLKRARSASAWFGMDMTLLGAPARAALVDAVPVENTSSHLIALGLSLALGPIVEEALGSIEHLDPEVMALVEGRLSEVLGGWTARRIAQLGVDIVDRWERGGGAPPSWSILGQSSAGEGPRSVRRVRVRELRARDGEVWWMSDDAQGRLLGLRSTSADAERLEAWSRHFADHKALVFEFADGGSLIAIPNARVIVNLELLGDDVRWEATDEGAELLRSWIQDDGQGCLAQNLRSRP